MLHGYNKNNLFSCSTIEELQQRSYIEFIDNIEGCLIDNILLYDHMYHKYYMCIECAKNEWSSCYQVIIGKDEILEKWDEFKQKMEEYKNE